MIAGARSIVQARWNLLRLMIAAFLLWVLAAGAGQRLASLELAALPTADYLSEARTMRAGGRFAEALIVCDAGLAELSGEPSAELAREREAIAAEQRGMLRRLKDVARGALTGAAPPTRSAVSAAAPDPSLELLSGAIATDLFIVGDIRDLIIQSARWVRGEETDRVLVALSGVGIITTLAPQIDWAPSLLKVARKSGAMTERFAGFLRRAASERNVAELRRTMESTAAMARAASPAGAVRLLKHVDNADDAAKLAAFLTRSGPRGADALRRTGAEGAALAKSAEALRAAGRVDEAVAVERALLLAGTKGRGGAAWLTRGGHRALLRPHPLVGLAKSVWKGNAQALARRLVDLLDPTASWALPAAATWVFVEAALLVRRWTRGKLPNRTDRRVPTVRPAMH